MKPKESFRVPLDENRNLSVAIFPTRNDPEAEVISVQISRYTESTWETEARIALYRSRDGNYSRLPDREKQSQ